MIYRSSQIKLAKQCPTKAYFRYSLGISPKGSGKNPDLFFGTVVHKAIEILLLEGQEKSNEYLSKLEFPPGAKTQSIAKILVNLFRMKFKDEVVACERYFQLDLDEEVTILGKYDLIAKNGAGIYVGDYKTTVPYYLTLKPDDQFISYFIAAREEFNAQHVVIYNLDPSSVDISMSLITYSEAEIDEWKKEIKKFLCYYQDCIDSSVIPKNPGACMDYGRRCEYYDLCTASPRIRQALIDGAFKIDKESLNLMW